MSTLPAIGNLDAQGQPTQRIIETRRKAEFIIPIPKTKRQKNQQERQKDFLFDEGKGLTSEKQRYDPNSLINTIRAKVDQWRQIPNPNEWGRNS